VTGVHFSQWNEAQFHKIQNNLEKSAMSKTFPGLQIDEKHSLAICKEIGERLRIDLSENPPLSSNLARLMLLLQELDHQASPSIVPKQDQAVRLPDATQNRPPARMRA
jgi:hypothetical protein